MKKDKYEVKIYYSGYCSYIIEADNEEEALKEARLSSINQKEIITNLEPWKEADTAEKMKSGKKSK